MRAIGHNRADRSDQGTVTANNDSDLSTELPTDADRVWTAMRHPASFLYVCRGVIGFPMRQGETGTSSMWLFHVIPLSQHTIHVTSLDGSTRSIYRYRQRRRRKLFANHLLPTGPAYRR